MNRASKHAVIVLFAAACSSSGRETRDNRATSRERPSLEGKQRALAVAATETLPALRLPSFSPLANALMRTVVSIQVVETVAHPSLPGPFNVLPFRPPRLQERGIGSGFLIDDSGLILTNAHVVDNAESIEVTVTMADKSTRVLEAEVLGEAPDFDVALIRTTEDAHAPGVATLGDSDAVQIGDWVMAIGNPFGLSHSVSVGIISAKERRAISPSGREGLYDFLQTDASINPGNSGGPLFNLSGEVIGINAAIAAEGQGIGFAIPINMVKKMLPALREKGGFVRSYLGVRVQALTPELAKSFGIETDKGVLIADVVPNSPAAKAGLLAGDIILRFGDKDLTDPTDLSLFSSMAGVGTEVPLTVWRDGRQFTVDVKLAPFPEPPGKEEGVQPERGNQVERIGLVVSDISPEIAQELNTNNRRGAVVRKVAPGSAASRANLQPGDIIRKVDGKDIASADDLISAVRAAKRGAVVRLQAERNGARFFAAVEKP